MSHTLGLEHAIDLQAAKADLQHLQKQRRMAALALHQARQRLHAIAQQIITIQDRITKMEKQP